jgi:hypothetical protein
MLKSSAANKFHTELKEWYETSEYAQEYGPSFFL